MEAEEAMSEDDTTKQPATEQDDKDAPTETTLGGLEVRTPTRGEFFANLKKVSKPDD